MFGFFGLHDLLWLQRTVVGKLRGEYPAVRADGGPYVRRFTPTQIGLHVTIVVSFLVLAAAGLPLKFAGAPWAPGLNALIGRSARRRDLHRIAAVVTFGYFGFHVLSALYQMVFKHQRGYLWGRAPWFAAGRRARLHRQRRIFPLSAPAAEIRSLDHRESSTTWRCSGRRHDRPYWPHAVFPGLFTRFLPGWVLNAAYITHSDEALLAAGFIFLFHYFHTHLRPKVFPMDP